MNTHVLVVILLAQITFTCALQCIQLDERYLYNTCDHESAVQVVCNPEGVSKWIKLPAVVYESYGNVIEWSKICEKNVIKITEISFVKEEDPFCIYQ